MKGVMVGGKVKLADVAEQGSDESRKQPGFLSTTFSLKNVQSLEAPRLPHHPVWLLWDVAAGDQRTQGRDAPTPTRMMAPGPAV